MSTKTDYHKLKKANPKYKNYYYHHRRRACQRPFFTED
jgi:hypothetical protein